MTTQDDETEYRIDFTLARRRPGEDDFTEIGFGSSGTAGTPAGAAYGVDSVVQNWLWETSPGMPDPEEIRRAAGDA